MGGLGFGFDIGFSLFYIMFFFVIGIFIFVFAKIIKEWSRNNNSPRLSVEAKIVDKRSSIHHSTDHPTHSYYITFEVQSGDRMELHVPRNEFGLLVVGDEGLLSFQGTRYLGFERKY